MLPEKKVGNTCHSDLEMKNKKNLERRNEIFKGFE